MLGWAVFCIRRRPHTEVAQSRGGDCVLILTVEGVAHIMTGSAAGEGGNLSVGEVLERDHHRIDGYFDTFAQSAVRGGTHRC